MNNMEYVGTLLESLRQKGTGKAEIVRTIGKACVGWPYVFGAWGEQCTPSGRNARKRSDHPTIVSGCQVLNGSRKDCSGCKWGIGVRMYDCRGFTHWVLDKAGINIAGAGCTSQWNTAANWSEKGLIAAMPRNKVCCVFTGTEKTKEHTGLYLGDGSTVECSSGVQFFEKMKSKWKYYAIPAGLYGGDQPEPEPAPPVKPTLRKGSRGEYVTLLQTMLINKGYSCGSSGADGIFGNDTLYAVKKFQLEHALDMDGIVGHATWAALEDNSAVIKLYTVHLPGLPLYKAEAIIKQYDGAWMEQEGGGA